MRSIELEDSRQWQAALHKFFCGWMQSPQSHIQAIASRSNYPHRCQQLMQCHLHSKRPHPSVKGLDEWQVVAPPLPPPPPTSLLTHLPNHTPALPLSSNSRFLNSFSSYFVRLKMINISFGCLSFISQNLPKRCTANSRLLNSFDCTL